MSPFFTNDTVKRLRDSGKVNGIMVAMGDKNDETQYPEDGFSSDLKCPNRESSIYHNDSKYSCGKHEYNPTGNGLMFEDLKMPIMLVYGEEDIKTIVDCYHTYNYASGNESVQEFPLCSVQLKAFMHGAGSSEICWRRNGMIRNFSPSSYCQKIGGTSSYSLLAADKPTNKLIVVIVRTDSFSLFDGIQPGTSSPVSSMSVMIAMAEALRQVKDDITASGYNVLFLALAGESYDYIGSQRIIYDIEHGWFPSTADPISLSDIELIVELSQLLAVVDSKALYAHTDPNTADAFSNVQRFISILNTVSSDINVKKVVDQPLPPSSSQMFIRAVPDDGMPAVVLSDYETKFETKFYNSYLDTSTAYGFNVSSYDNVTVQAATLANIASLISQAIYQYSNSNNGSTNPVKADNMTVNNILYCLLTNPKCELFYQITSPDYLEQLSESTGTFPFYVGVFKNATTPSNFIQMLTKNMLAYFSGSSVSAEDDGACRGHNGTWMNGPLVNGTRHHVCYNNSSQYYAAVSPAFDIKDYDFSSTQYSTWTESVWPSKDPFHIKLFLRPSTEVELACMVAGISLFIASAILIVYIHRRAGILFPRVIPSLDSTEPL